LYGIAASVAIVLASFAGACSGGPASPRDASDGQGAGDVPDAAAGDAARTCSLAAVGEEVVSLAGAWSFTPSGGATTTIQVPGGGWLAQGFHVSAARYETSVTVPDLGRPQATLIELGAVNHQASLSIDGNLVATNMTAFTPSVFDVTRAVTPGAAHALAIDVKGRDALRSPTNAYLTLVPDAAGWSPNVPQGIFRSAVVRTLPALHVSDTFVRTDVANDALSVDVWISNSGTSDATGTVSAVLSSFTCEELAYPTLANQTVAVPAGGTVQVTLGPVRWDLGPQSFWWPNIPYTPGYRAKLHYVSVTVAGNDAKHTVPFRFGFRQIRQVAANYELNGVRVNFRGDNLQGADYDSIETTATGTSDAYDLFPGFLPPSPGNRGWPGAVDNWQRLNYNVARIHQEPATPYMLDVADELGFMLIDETAIRGSNGDQDFRPAPAGGEPNMLAHLQALVLRDRNHPSIIRWSQCNEADNDSTNSAAFQQDLYLTVTAIDATRPVSAEGRQGDASYKVITADNFTVMDHYPDGLNVYTHTVRPSTTRPFGVGEYIWSSDVTPQGMVWFGTSTMAMRLQGADDLRPYTLLSGWASFVPGVTTAMMTLEPTYPARVINHPHFGEDNLPDPWSNPIIQRIQRGMNPVAVVDTAFWAANSLSNVTGDWPVATETAALGASLTRQLAVFNDTLSGTSVDVVWEVRTDAADGPIVSQGDVAVDVPLGEHATVPITVTLPSTGTRAYLVLRSRKDGREIFVEDAEWFQLQ
jgi:hypothetical protein